LFVSATILVNKAEYKEDC